MENGIERGRRPADRRQYQKAYRLRYKALAKRVSLTFTASEYAAIRARAAAGGMPVAAFLKRTLESRPRPGAPPRMPEGTEAALEAMVRQLRGIATNVNQMARRSNVLRTEVDGREVLFRIGQIEEIVRWFLMSLWRG